MGAILNVSFASIIVVVLSAPTAFAAKAGDRGKLISRSEGGDCYELRTKGISFALNFRSGEK